MAMTRTASAGARVAARTATRTRRRWQARRPAARTVPLLTRPAPPATPEGARYEQKIDDPTKG
jgi:hypothetical protein